MAKTIQKLSALFVGRVKEPGMYADGGGLYLQVTSSGAKSWIYRFEVAGRERAMGLAGARAPHACDASPSLCTARRGSHPESGHSALVGIALSGDQVMARAVVRPASPADAPRNPRKFRQPDNLSAMVGVIDSTSSDDALANRRRSRSDRR